MSHQPMSGGGLDIDMVSGQPAPKAQEAKQAEAKARYDETLSKSLDLLCELQNGSPGFRIAVKQAYARLEQLAKEDPIFQANLAIILAYRYEIEVVPRLALEMLRMAAGPKLVKFVEEPEAAPGGIPAE